MDFFLMTERARSEAESLRMKLIESGSYSPLESVGYPLSQLRETQVFGVLIANTKSNEEVVLYGYSGSINGSFSVPGYVPPCFSQHEFERIVAINDKAIHDLTAKIENGDKSLVEERARLSNETLERLRGLYTFYTWNGEKIVGLPDGCRTGTGDCAGIKLINQALKRGYEIKGLAEFRLSGEYLPPCHDRCGLILPKMLGLNIIYADEDIAVLNKPEGFLSVPGRGEDKLDSASYRFHKLFPSSPVQCNVHRLDMDTSGILVMAFNKEAHKKLNMAFEKREVHKTYIALLEGKLDEDEGIIDLPIRLDVERRPYQIVDYENGKRAVTRWEKLKLVRLDGRLYTRVRFFPETGRTHQLRVHSASGLHHPIKGDRLYGRRREGERLALHSESITFVHPRSGKELTFFTACSF